MTVITEDQQMEILLVFGMARGGNYWSGVFQFLRARRPELFAQDQYPDAWHSNKQHAHDMEILREIYHWQRELETET